MNVLNRLLVIAVVLAATGGAILLMLLAANVILPEQLTANAWLLERIQSLDTYAASRQLTTILISFAVVLLGLTLLYYELRFISKSEPRLVLQQSGQGRMTVSISGISELANHAARQVAGVIEATTKVASKAKGLRVESRVSVEPSAKLADTTKELQERVKTTLEEHLGYPVDNVNVNAQLAPLNGGRGSTMRKLR